MCKTERTLLWFEYRWELSFIFLLFLSSLAPASKSSSNSSRPGWKSIPSSWGLPDYSSLTDPISLQRITFLVSYFPSISPTPPPNPDHSSLRTEPGPLSFTRVADPRTRDTGRERKTWPAWTRWVTHPFLRRSNTERKEKRRVGKLQPGWKHSQC